MKIYVCGPMTGIYEFNQSLFNATTADLEFLGHDVFNPVAQDEAKHGVGFLDGTTGDQAELAARGFSLGQTLSEDLAWIANDADAICVLPGYLKSKGARAECALAEALGIPLAYAEDFDEDGIAHAQPCLSAAFTVGDIVDPAHAKRRRAEAFIAGLTPPAGLKVPDDSVAPLDSQPSACEIRTRSSLGGEKGVKSARYDLMPAGPLEELAKLYGQGAAKYADHQYRQGYEYSKSFAAMMRHAWAWWGGEDNDPEMGTSHMASVAWHALALIDFHQRQLPGMDDRWVA